MLPSRSGLLGAAIRGLVLGAPRNLLTAVVVFAAVVSNTASEMGYVVLIPLAAVVFHSVGRHPLVGLAAAFAGVSGGYSANILIGTVDPLLSGITTEAAQIIDPAYALGGGEGSAPHCKLLLYVREHLSHHSGGHPGDQLHRRAEFRAL